MEIFIAYLHEITHMFITFLALEYVHNRYAVTPDRMKIEWLPIDSGFTFENIIFGGNYVRVNDESGREYKFMVNHPRLALR